jgi:hypothetical protein
VIFAIELCLGCLLLYGIVTQLGIPIYRDTKLFPMFKREAKLISELTDIKQKIVEKKLSETINSTKKKEGF